MNEQLNTDPLLVERMLHATWRMPIWLVVSVALLSAFFAWWIYWAERGRAGKGVRCLLGVLRFALLMTVLWMLAGWSWLRFKSDPPEIVFMFDNSTSMNTRDASDDEQSGTTRLERAIALFESLDRKQRQEWLEAYRARWFTVADTLDSQDFDFISSGRIEPRPIAEGSHSRLGEGLLAVLERQAGRGTAAIVFITDGINTSGATLADAADAARRAAIPLYTVSVGRQVEMPDLRLADLLHEQQVYLGDQVIVEAAVVAMDVESNSTNVVLEDAANGQVLDEARISVSNAQSQVTARLSFVPERAGEIRLRARVTPVEGESQLDNNTLETTVIVEDKTIRVLMVSEYPSYEFRFLKNFLQRTVQAGEAVSSFDVHSVLQKSDPEYVDQNLAALRLVPSNPRLLEEYDVFVFGEFEAQLVSGSAQQTIYEAVTQGGAGCIFLYGGRDPLTQLQGWPLENLLPIQRSGSGSREASIALPFRWQPTPLGTTALPMQLGASPVQSLEIWKTLPPLTALCPVEQPKVGAQVVAEAVALNGQVRHDLLITQFAGAGRTALQATDETYRWTSFQGSDFYYQRYWGQMLRWLARGRLRDADTESELMVDPQQPRYGQPVRIQAKLDPNQSKPVEVTLASGEGEQQRLKLARSPQTPGLYDAILTNLLPGSYRAVLSQPALERPPNVDFRVTAPPGEQADLRANIEGLQQLAERTRGRYYHASEAEQLFAELPSGKATRLGSLPPLPLWNSPWVAAMFVLMITAEWILRRRAQML